MSDPIRPQTSSTGAASRVPRKSPNFLRFIATGAILGFVVGGLIAATGILEDPEAATPGYNYGASAGVGIVGLLGAGLFAIAAAVLAVILDRRSGD